MVELLSCLLHAVKILAFRVGEHAMVLGAVPIGLGVIAHLKNVSAGLIIATKTIEKRIEVAKKVVVDYVFNPQEVPNLK